MNAGYGRNTTKHWKQRECKYHLLETVAPTQKVLFHTLHSNCLPEDISPFIQASCFRIVGNMVDPVNPMDLGTLQPFN